MVMAASGSVGETIAPSANAAAQDMSATRPRETTATAAAVIRTSATAISEIARASARTLAR